MTYNPNIHHRKSIRLKGYDYAQQGLYFITICCQNMGCLFGNLVGAPLVGAQNPDAQNVGAQNPGAQNPDAQNVVVQNTDFQNVNAQNTDPQNTVAQMILNDAGKMIETEWLTLTNRFTNIILHEFVVMPNHFHGIIEIADDFSAIVRAPLVGAHIKSLSNDVISLSNDVISPSNDVILPNDFDNKNEGRPQGYAPTHNTDNPKTIGDILNAFKSITTVKYINGVKNYKWQPFNGKIWQRNYHDHIIRNHTSYQNISNYIINNPLKWYEDKFYQKTKYHL